MPPRFNKAGDETRTSIMALVRRRHAAGLPPQTLRGIARELGRNPAGIHRQLSTLTETGELERAEVAEGVIVYRLPTPRE